MYWLILYDKNTGQIEGYFSNNCNYLPAENVPNLDPKRLTYARLENPLFEVSLDHKLIVEEGKVEGSSPSPRLNPPQPDPFEPSRDLESEIDELKLRIKTLEARKIS